MHRGGGGAQQTARTADERQADKQEQNSKKKKKGARSGSGKNRETQKGGGAAATRQQPMTWQETQKHRERTESRAAGEQKEDRGGGSRRREPPTSTKQEGKGKAAEKEKKGGAPGNIDENRETQRGWGGSSHQGAANDQAGNTKATKGKGEPGSGRPTKQTRGGGGGGGRREPPTSAKQAGKSKAAEEKKNRGGHRAASTKTTRHQGGGGGSNHQGAAHDPAENIKAAGAHEEPRSGRPTKQTTHSAKAQGTWGPKSEKARDNGGAKEKGGTKGKQSAKAKGTRGRKPEEEGDNRGAQRERARRKKASSGATPAQRGPSKAEGKSRQRKGEAHQNTPGRPARPTRPRGTSTRTHSRDPGVASSDPQGEVSASTRNSPGAPAESLVDDGLYGKPDASVTGSTHANYRSARSPRPTPEGPARDNPIAGPRTGTTQSEPSATASAGASGRHNEPGSRPATACPAQPPSKAEGASPGGAERYQGVGKADRSTESDRTRRGAAHHTGPRGTPERHAAGHNQGTRTVAKQQRPPGAANPVSAHSTQQTTAREAVPSNTSSRPD